MFGSNGEKKEPQSQANPGVRSSIYGMAALYLLYLSYKIVAPYLRGDPDRPTTLQFVMGLVLAGAGVGIAVLAWRLYRLSKELQKEALENEEVEEGGDWDGEEGDIEDSEDEEGDDGDEEDAL